LPQIEIEAMNIEQTPEVDDLAAAIREGRPLQHAHAYRVSIAVDGVAFQEARVPTAHPFGRQIVGAAGLDPHADPSLFAILLSGDFDEIVLDQPVDLRGLGAERFIVFTGDRDFKFTMNGAQMRWWKAEITGEELCVLGGATEHDVAYLLTEGGGRHAIERNVVADLGHRDVEHFVIGPREEDFEIVVNGRDIRVNRRHQTFDDLVALAFPNQPHAPNVIYSITFRRAASEPHTGELGVGGAIEVKNGTIVNVSRTVQS
jgi:hypothetical protein